MKIYHNPRCRKSREGLAILEAQKEPFEVIRYMDNPPDKDTLRDLLEKLGMTPMELIRKNEAIWKADYRDKDLDDDAVLEAMIAHPRLIERPVVVRGDKAVVGRPPERIRELFK